MTAGRRCYPPMLLLRLLCLPLEWPLLLRLPLRYFPMPRRSCFPLLVLLLLQICLHLRWHRCSSAAAVISRLRPLRAGTSRLASGAAWRGAAVALVAAMLPPPGEDEGLRPLQ